MLRAEIKVGARPRIEDQRIVGRHVRTGERPFHRLGVDRQRVIAIAAQPFGGEFKFAGWRVEAGLPIGAEGAGSVFAIFHRRVGVVDACGVGH